VEIDIPALEKLSNGKREVRPLVDEYVLKGNRKVYLLGEGRLVNLATAEGHTGRGNGYELREPSALGGIPAEELQNAEPQVYVCRNISTAKSRA